MNPLREMGEVLSELTGRSRMVVEYGMTVKRILDSASEPGFGRHSWAPLAEFVDTDRFDRVGNFKDLMTWPEYVDFLTAWAPGASWEASFRRVTQAGDLVFLELEERTTMGGTTSAAWSMSAYEFDEQDRLVHIDVYLQMPVPREFLPPFYANVRLAD